MTAHAVLPPAEGRAFRLSITVEAVVLIILGAAAVGLRWLLLGQAVLNENEAAQAIASLRLADPATAGTGEVVSPLLWAGMALTFAVGGVSEATARLVPALAGTALVFTPLLFRHRLGRLPALAAAGWLAISPTAVISSRLVDGTSLAALAMVAALDGIDRYLEGRSRKMLILSGSGLGMALLADPGSLFIFLAWGLGLAFAILTDEEEVFSAGVMRGAIRQAPWGAFLAGLIGVLALLGTLFMTAPEGLGYAADSFGQMAQSLFSRPQGHLYAGLTLALYEPFLILFGILGAWGCSQASSPRVRFLAGWGIAAFMLNILIPNTLPVHGLWSVLPLAILAGHGVASVLALKTDDMPSSRGVAVLVILALAAMAFISLAHHLRAPRLLPIPTDAAPGEALYQIPLDLLLFCLWMVMMVLVWLGTASLWGQRTTWHVFGIAAAIMGSSLAAGRSGIAASTNGMNPYEPIYASPAQPETRLFVETAAEIGRLNGGFAYDVPMTVQGSPNGLLGWLLRDFRSVQYVGRVDPRVDSVLVVTPAEGVDPALGSGYVGQDLALTGSWTPQALSFKDLLLWTIYRTAPSPASETRVILWVREDSYLLLSAQP
jgi:uncharacterized protein (TIGR03663 family)